METMPKETVEKVRAAIKDRAVWFALLFRAFEGELGRDEAVRIARKAIRNYGHYKGSLDGKKLSAEEMMERFETSGGTRIFGAEIEACDEWMENRVGYCALVEAWKEMGLSSDDVNLFCDIAMDGDRGRAEYHGVELRLEETLARNDGFCRICLKRKQKV